MNFYISDIPESFPIGEEFRKKKQQGHTDSVKGVEIKSYISLSLLIVERPLWSFMFISFLIVQK